MRDETGSKLTEYRQDHCLACSFKPGLLKVELNFTVSTSSEMSFYASSVWTELNLSDTCVSFIHHLMCTAYFIPVSHVLPLSDQSPHLTTLS